MKIIKNFITEVDKRYSAQNGPKTTLFIFGTSALFLQTDYVDSTKDTDVLEVNQLPQKTKDLLNQIAGKDSQLAKDSSLFLEIVAKPIPFLPNKPIWHPLTELNQGLNKLEFMALDITDVVVSKLKPFRPGDIKDIEAMIDRELIDHKILIERFKLALDRWTIDARGEQLPKIIQNINFVETNMLHVPLTQFELPRYLTE